MPNLAVRCRGRVHRICFEEAMHLLKAADMELRERPYNCANLKLSTLDQAVAALKRGATVHGLAKEGQVEITQFDTVAPVDAYIVWELATNSNVVEVASIERHVPEGERRYMWEDMRSCIQLPMNQNIYQGQRVERRWYRDDPFKSEHRRWNTFYCSEATILEGPLPFSAPSQGTADIHTTSEALKAWRQCGVYGNPPTRFVAHKVVRVQGSRVTATEYAGTLARVLPGHCKGIGVGRVDRDVYEAKPLLSGSLLLALENGRRRC